MLNRAITIPKKLLDDPSLPLEFCSINIIAPDTLMITPAVFLGDIGSFRNMAESSNTTIGLKATISDQVMGDVNRNPMEKKSCVRAMPSIPPAAIINKSLRPAFSLTVKKPRSENIITLKNIRVKVKPIGVIQDDPSRDLDIFIFKPKITFAVKAARCPIIFSSTWRFGSKSYNNTQYWQNGEELYG